MPFYVRGTALKNRLDALFKLIMGKIYDTNAPGYRRNDTSARDKAITQLLFYTAIRLGECVALNLDDVRVSARKGVAIIRSGKGDTYREVPLNAEVREALRVWRKRAEQTVLADLRYGVLSQRIRETALCSSD